jgi:uncharacterized membrane protein/uncharacterized lipoprotein NlpE involved in copper resistance
MGFFAFRRWRTELRATAAVALAAAGLAMVGAASASSQAPVADGPYVGTLPCADCAGIRTVLTLYTLGGQPYAYRMTATYLGTHDGDRTEERMGPWTRLDDGKRVRIEPFNDNARQSFRRVDGTTLVLLDRQEKPIGTQQDVTLKRDATATAPRLPVPPTLYRGTLTRQGDRLMLAPCGGGKAVRVYDVSPEVMITAALTDIGFDKRGRMYLEAHGTTREGALMLHRLNRAGVEMSCPKEPVAFRAQGNEPSWGLLSTRERVSFMRPGEPALNAPPLPLSWRWPGGRGDRATAVMSSSTESSAITAVLTPRVCRDTMADAVYGFTASVRLERPTPGREFKGCAFLGTSPLP